MSLFFLFCLRKILYMSSEQYATLLSKAAELDIPLEDLLLWAIENFIKEDESHA